MKQRGEEAQGASLVKGSTLLKLFRQIANLKLAVRAADVREIDGGIEINLPSLAVATLPPLWVYAVPDSGGRFGVMPGTVGSLMPEINGIPLDHDEPPLLNAGAGLIVIAVEVFAVLTEGGYRPAGRIGTDLDGAAAVRIGWEAAFTADRPALTWGGRLSGDPVQPDTITPDDTTFTAGRFIVPLATVMSNGSIVQHILLEPGVTDLDLGVQTSIW